MSSNVRFIQDGRTMFGTQFGYAIEYVKINAFDGTCIYFAENLTMPDDPQNWKQPLPIDLVSECIYVLAKEEKKLIVKMYERYVLFSNADTCYDIKKRIRDIQISLIKFDSNLSPDVRNYLNSGIFQLIKGMPVH